MIAVSVIVPTYNRLPIVRETVRRLLKQDCTGGEYEVLVVDDQSADGTFEWLTEAARQSSQLRPARNPRKGRAGARNTGLSLARGQIIYFLDDDMWVAPGFLDAHWEAHQQAGAATTRAVVGRMRPSPENGPTLANLIYDKRLMRIDGEMAAFNGPLTCNYLCTGNVSMPRALFEAGLRFDEGFTGYSFEDTDLGYQLEAQGVELWYAPAAHAEHRTSTSLDELLRKQGEAGWSAIRLLQRHPQAAERLDIPFEVPGIPLTTRSDRPLRRAAKWLFLAPPTGSVLVGAIRAAQALGCQRLATRCFHYAGYHRYARAYRKAAATAAAVGQPETSTRAGCHEP